MFSPWLHMTTSFSSTIVITTPLLKECIQYVTPHAADWKVIGILLDIPVGELKCIEATNVKWCCNQMLEKWLEIDPDASWNKLNKVIESLSVSSTPDIQDKGS